MNPENPEYSRLGISGNSRVRNIPKFGIFWKTDSKIPIPGFPESRTGVGKPESELKKSGLSGFRPALQGASDLVAVFGWRAVGNALPTGGTTVLWAVAPPLGSALCSDP